MSANLRLLSLDGGGVRGLASLYMLKMLLSHVGDPKPCEYFDMICGTSTGGLIAIMLGRLEMTVLQCIEAFTTLMGVIFKKKRFRLLPIKPHNGEIEPKYASENLESAIKSIIAEAGQHRDALFRGTKQHQCRTVVMALAAGSGSTVRFTDYTRVGEHDNFYNEVKIWEVARATSAATTFFEPMTIKAAGIDRTYVDAGLGFNNPVNQVYFEATEQLIKSGEKIDDRIRVLLSIGTGRPALRAFGTKIQDIGKSLIKMVSETQNTADDFDRTHQTLSNSNRYFRFNPPDLQEVGLDEASEKGVISERCEAFASDPNTGRMVRQWQLATGAEQIQPEPFTDLGLSSNPPRTQLFYTLHRSPRFIRESAKTYWRYLTLDSYNVYERIYGMCKNPHGQVSFRALCGQLEPRTPKRTILEIWARLFRDPTNAQNLTHGKAFVMAVLYMLHVESCLDVSKMRNIDLDRREVLKRFAKWVTCTCNPKCHVQWNFVNELGLPRGDENQSNCDLCRILENHSWTILVNREKVRKLEAARRQWLANT